MTKNQESPNQIIRKSVCNRFPMRQRESGDENCCESDSVNDERDDADHEVGHERKEGGRTEEQERDRNEPGADGRDCARVEVLESIGKNIFHKVWFILFVLIFYLLFKFVNDATKRFTKKKLEPFFLRRVRNSTLRNFSV